MTTIPDNLTTSAESLQANPGKPAKGGIDASLAQVISAISGTAVQPGDLKNQQISEDVLLAALVHQKLQDTRPELGNVLLERLPQSFNRKLENRSRQPLFRAIDTILSREVTRGNLRRSDKARIIRSAFGESQIDTRTGRLSNQFSGGRSINAQEAAHQIKLNKGAAADRSTMVSFRQRLQNRPEMGEALYHHLSTRFDNLKKTAPALAADTPADKSPSATGNFDPGKIVSDKFDFIYTPAAGRTGKARVELPVSYSEKVRAVGLFLKDELLAELSFAGISKNGRAIWNHKQAGGELPENTSIRMVFLDDSMLQYDIKDPTKVYRRRVGSGE